MEIKPVGERKFLLLSWSDVEHYVDKLESLIAGDGYTVDTLVGVLRGGMIVADLLSDLLGVREIYVVGCKSYTGTMGGELKLYHDLQLADLKGRNVLLVDDVADTGATLDAAVNKVLKPRQPSRLKTATLLTKPWSSVKPDYTADHTDAWIIFPWERMETVKTVGKLFVEKMGFDQALAELAAISRLAEHKIAESIKNFNP
ncbi:MAG: phosphoribosyltransferase [Candidatus Caldarchaeum sp.]|uniref:Phosphoribosyltransferase n=1 Tax=Caldiarchaeum subterraneum TaxID=311458 RepID=A0A7C5Q892_CALS0